MGNNETSGGKMNLSPKQKEIVEAPIGHLLVKATAGSGKTRVLTARIRYLLERDALDGVLALTYTNKAALEMVERLRDVKDLKRRTFIGTIHSFAIDVLERHGRHIGYDSMPQIFERDEDRLRLLEEALLAQGITLVDPVEFQNNRKQEQTIRQQLALWLDRISIIKRELLSDEEIELRYPDKTLAVYREYNDILASYGGVDYDDLLVLAYRIINEAVGVQRIYTRGYPHVCVDESQDLNFAQYELIRSLCQGNVESVMLVGAPEQSIYGFNGSSPKYMDERFVADFAPAQYVLDENFRSAQKILQLAERLKPGSQELAKEKAHVHYEGRSILYSAQNEEQEAEWICSQIDALLKEKTHGDIEGEITLENMVVLARNRYVFLPLEEKLKNRGYEYYLKRPPGAPVFESQTVQLFDLALRVKLYEKDRLHARQLAAMCKLSWSDSSNVKTLLQEIGARGKESFPGVAQLLPLFLEEIERQQNGPVIDLSVLLDKLIDSIKNSNGNPGISSEEKERAVQEFEDLREHWDRYIFGLPSASTISLSGFKTAMAMGKTQPEAIQKGLALSTVHTMKGLEYDIVFLMGMGQGTFPDYRAIQKGKTAIEEERNIAFVAITRARRFLYISYPKVKEMPWGDTREQAPSQFISEINKNHNIMSTT